MERHGVSRRSVLAAGATVALTGLPVRRAHAATDFLADEIAPGIFVVQGRHELFSPVNEGHIANVSFVIGRDAIAVIDTGGSAHVGAAIMGVIRQKSDRPVRYVINTHMHPDHLFGNAAFTAAETLFVGHFKLPRGLAARGERYMSRGLADLGPQAFAGTKLIPATELVTTTKTLDLGDRTLALTAHKTAHTDNDLTVWDETTKTLFLGDLLFSGHVPTLDGSIRGWIDVLAALSRQNADRVVPGHGPTSMNWPQGCADEQRYLEAIVRDVRGMIKRGVTLEEATLNAAVAEKDSWLLFDEFHKRNVSAAFAELEWE
jgi:quinoprotein relay system zinc metallohydrolase 2